MINFFAIFYGSRNIEFPINSRGIHQLLTQNRHLAAEINIYAIYDHEIYAVDVGIGRKLSHTGKDRPKKTISLLSLDIEVPATKASLFGEGHILPIKVQ